MIEWLGAYYIEAQFSEKAVNYFERAALIQYGEFIQIKLKSDQLNVENEFDDFQGWMSDKTKQE